MNILIKLVGLIELLIGLTTVLFVTIFSAFSIVEKPLNVFIFVVTSAVISASIGYGILNYRNWARVSVVFFSGYVIALKFLIFLNIMQFTGEIFIILPSYIKDSISVLYHAFLMIFFTHKSVISKFVTEKI